VPYADGTLVAVPGADFSDARLASLLALTDAMPTGYHAAISGGVKKGDTVAVVGDGAVGLCAVLTSHLLGATRIILLASTHEDRHQLAREWGADEIITARGADAIHAVHELTGGYGADAVLECAGTKDAISTAFGVAKPGSIVGRVGVPQAVRLNAVETFYKNIGMRGGPAPARAYQPDLLRAVLAAEINPGLVFDLSIDLDDIDDGYAAMDGRRAIKTLVRVSTLQTTPIIE
jgi:alcohol dehydrogenase